MAGPVGDRPPDLATAILLAPQFGGRRACRSSITDTGDSTVLCRPRWDHPLEIDRLFVQELSDNTDQRGLVAAMVAMGSALDRRIVAEGSRSPSRRPGLRTLGCHTAQGYLYAEPGRPDQINGMLHGESGGRYGPRSVATGTVQGGPEPENLPG